MKKDWQRYLKFRCTGCGNCCKGTMVMLTDADVRRLVEGTGRPFEDFARFVHQDDIVLDKRSPWWIRLQRARYVMALRWRRGACVFLDPENRCTVYDHRPVACREHPFNITLSVTGGLYSLSRSNIVPCPHEWDGDIKRRDLIALSNWTNRESEAYTERVKAWNRRREGRRTMAEYLRFLGL